MKKVLVILPCISLANGVSAYALNYYNNINADNIKFDFVVVKESDKKLYEKFEKNGSKVFEIIKKNESFIKYILKIKNFIKNVANDYDIIHSHVYNSGAFFLFFSKLYGINMRILHSHATVSSDVLSHRIINSFLIPIAKYSANKYCACSIKAGNFLFKNKKFDVINNAIDMNKYEFNNIDRERYKKELGLENKFVIGNIGRLCKQKNQEMLLDIFKGIYLNDENVRLLIIGDGVLEKELKEKVEKLNIKNGVIFLGARNDVNKLYNVMDVFVLTSLYEGLPVVGIEAQINGIPCVFSDSITKEVKIGNNVQFISLKDKKEKWIDAILRYKDKKRISISKLDCDYDIAIEAEKLERIYEE